MSKQQSKNNNKEQTVENKQKSTQVGTETQSAQDTTASDTDMVAGQEATNESVNLAQLPENAQLDNSAQTQSPETDSAQNMAEGKAAFRVFTDGQINQKSEIDIAESRNALREENFQNLKSTVNVDVSNKFDFAAPLKAKFLLSNESSFTPIHNDGNHGTLPSDIISLPAAPIFNVPVAPIFAVIPPAGEITTPVFTPIEITPIPVVVAPAEPEIENPAPIEVTPAPIEVTPAPIEVTPAPIEVTPAPIEVTPTPIEVTPAPIEVTPAPIEVTPAPIEVTPAPIEVTPAPIEVTPTPIEVTPAPIEVTPAPIEVTPAPIEVTPTPIEVTPAPIEVTPAPIEVTPAPEPEPVKEIEPVKSDEFDSKWYGTEGDDYFIATNGTVAAHGGMGNDRLEVNFHEKWDNDNNSRTSARSDGKISGGYGDDQIDITMNNSKFFLSIKADDVKSDDKLDGNDTVTLHGKYANAVVDMGGGDDVFNGGDYADNVNGGNGNDTLFGNDGVDTLNGGAGNDVIWGGQGGDNLTGGEGADVFAWNKEDMESKFDTISDFNAKEDRLDISAILGEYGEKAQEAMENFVKFVETKNGKTIDTLVQVSAEGDKEWHTIAKLTAVDLGSGLSYHNIIATHSDEKI